MRLATVRSPGGQARAVEIRGQEVVAFPMGTTVHDLLALDAPAPADGGETWGLTEVELLAPVPRPRAIFGIGLNYANHARETGQELPERPIVFMKLPASSAPPGAPVRVPEAAAARLDYEGELVAVLGPAGRVAGYAVGDDLSARDLQGAEPQWTRAKAFDASCPWGPWITTVDEVGDPEALHLRTWVNGDLRQDSPTSELVFGPQACADFIAETCTLEPGDLILTGTPAGVGQGRDPRTWLAPGDVIRIEIEGLGTIEHAIA